MRRVETVVIILVLGFYSWFLGHFGLSDTLHYVRLVGWGLAATVALETVARIANAFGWRAAIEHYPPSLRFIELFGARIAGEAVDYTTPSAQLGGQLVMALAVRRKLRVPVGLATVIISALAEGVGQIVFITIALLCSATLVPRAERLLWPIAGGFAVALGLLFGFFWVQKRHPFTHLWRTAAKLDIRRFDTSEVRASADEADAILIDFYARHRARLMLSCLGFLFAWSLGPIEIYILLSMLHQTATIKVALMVEAVGLLIERATFLIPAKLVSQEGGKALILSVLGYPAGVGFAVGFLRRLKEMIWVMFGLVALMIFRAFVESAPAPSQRPPEALPAPAAHARPDMLEIVQPEGELPS